MMSLPLFLDRDCQCPTGYICGDIIITDINMPIEDFPEWEHENIKAAKEILETDDYISLPAKFDIHEYAIMEQFCLSINDDG